MVHHPLLGEFICCADIFMSLCKQMDVLLKGSNYWKLMTGYSLLWHQLMDGSYLNGILVVENIARLLQ